MFLTTHVLLPLSTEIFLAKKKIINATKPFMIATAIGGLIPDIDLFLQQPSVEHHQSLLHAPLFWLVALIVGASLVKLLKKQALLPIIIGFSIGTLSHVFLDTFGVSIGIAWLAPFSWQEYSFTPLTPVIETTWVPIYLTSKVFLAEVIMTISLLVFLFLESKRTRALPRNSLQ